MGPLTDAQTQWVATALTVSAGLQVWASFVSWGSRLLNGVPSCAESWR